MGGLIVYLHGFCSSPASWKARLMAEAMAARGAADRFHCPALSWRPREAVAQAERILALAAGPATLVGSSLGGHYATYLAEKHDLPAVLINPAVVDRLDLSLFAGEHENFHTGERFSFAPGDADDLLSQVVRHPDPRRYLLLVEAGDEVLDHRLAVERYRGSRQVALPGGDHSFTRFADYIADILDFACV